MTLAISSFRNYFTSLREWELNPVVVKELRQAVRSRMVTVILLVLLAALFTATLYSFAKEGDSVKESDQLGQPVFRIFLVILTVASFVFIPLYTGIRLAAERWESELDLMFVTPLPPGKIIRGKFYCGAYMAFLLFSVCLPFMTFTNLLRGIDLPTIFFTLICLYAALCLAVQAAILVACFPIHRSARVVAGILFAAGLLAACGVLIAFLLDVARSGAGAVLRKPVSRVGFVGVMVLIGLGIQLFHVVSVDLIKTDSRPRGYFNEVIPEGAQ